MFFFTESCNILASNFQMSYLSFMLLLLLALMVCCEIIATILLDSVYCRPYKNETQMAFGFN